MSTPWRTSWPPHRSTTVTWCPAVTQVSCDWWRAGHVTTVLTSDWLAQVRAAGLHRRRVYRGRGRDCGRGQGGQAAGHVGGRGGAVAGGQYNTGEESRSLHCIDQFSHEVRYLFSNKICFPCKIYSMSWHGVCHVHCCQFSSHFPLDKTPKIVIQKNSWPSSENRRGKQGRYPWIPVNLTKYYYYQALHWMVDSLTVSLLWWLE